MVKNYFIGVDNGTQSTKTIIIDAEDGSIIGQATKAYSFIQGLPPGHKEQDPVVWVNSLNVTIQEALRQAEIDPRTIRAIGISAQQHGLVALNEKGDVIRPAKLWNDTSTVQECNDLVNKLGGVTSVINLIGNVILPGYTAGKILWLKRHEPENYAKLRTVLLPHNYLNYYLTGRKVMEYGDASGTALMDVKTRTWSKKIIEAIDSKLIDKLPPLQSSDKSVGLIKREVAELFGLTGDVLVSSGGGDNMMGAIGTGNTKEGIVTTSLGTSGTIYAYSNTPIIDFIGEVAAFCDSTNAWLPLLCTMNVTIAVEYIRELFNLSYDKLTEMLKHTSVGSDGLILLPYFEGERTPNIPEGTGLYYGLNNRTFNRFHMVRATIEGVTLGLNYGLNRMRTLGICPKEIRLTGGGSKNDAWKQIVADVFNTEVVCLQIDEGAAYGAALQAMWTFNNLMGERTSIQKITDRFVQVDEATRASPKESNVKIYQKLQTIQDQLSLSIRNTFKLHRKYLIQHSS